MRIFLVLLAIATSSAGYIYGYLHQSDNAYYTGMRGINASDYSQHLSWIDQSRDGHFFIQNKFTSELQGGDLVRPVYFLLSQPFRLTGLSNGSVFHIQRIVCGSILLFLLLFVLFKRYDPDPGIQIRAFVLLAFTSGLGFLVRHWMQSADLDIPEAFLFVSLGEAPHFVYSLLFLWAGIAFFYAGFYAIYFVCLLVLWWEHPFEAVTLLVICSANLWIVKQRKTQLIILFISAAISVPPFLYYQHLKKIPAFEGWGSAQNLMLSPPIHSYLFAFLPLLILAFLGFRTLQKKPEKRTLWMFLCVWTVVQFALAYVPAPFQRRLIAGVQFPLALLAAYGLREIRKPLVASLVIAVMCITNSVVIQRSIAELKPQLMPFYLSKAYRDAFLWLDQQKDKSGVVLSGFVTGNLIPGFSGFQSYLGHSSLTPNVVQKRKEVADFYREPTVSFLIKNRIRYIVFGLEERNLSSTQMDESFQAVYENDQVTILSPEPKIEGMNIVIGGHSRNIGKTSVVAGIIHATQEKNWTAIKVTQFGHGVCSRNGQSCHCATDDHKYAIVEERNPKGRGDTCRFLAAGAKRSVWVRTKQGMLNEAMPHLRGILEKQQNTIIESNSIVEFIDPDLYVVVLDYSVKDFKVSSKKFLARADACILIRGPAQIPEWDGVQLSNVQHKMRFDVTPPQYITPEIIDFVRSHSS